MVFSQWINYFRARFASEEGQTMAEYGVVLAVIALGVLVGTKQELTVMQYELKNRVGSW